MVSFSRASRETRHGLNYRIYLGKDTQNWAIHVNNYFMHGDHSHLMKNTETIDSYVIRIRQVATLLVWVATDIRSI